MFQLHSRNVTTGPPHIEQIGTNMCTTLPWDLEGTIMDP